jgi:hypothetical protein
MEASISLILLVITISVPWNYPDETKFSQTDRNLSLPESSFLPDAMSVPIANLSEPNLTSISLPDTTSISASSLRSISIPDTTSTTAVSPPDSVTLSRPSDTGPDTVTVTSGGTKSDPGTILKRNSITLYYLLRSDRQAHTSGINNSSDDAEIKSNESLTTGGISSENNFAGYNLQVTDNLFAWVREMTRIYSSDSWHLLMQYEDLPRVSEARHAGNKILSMPKLVGTFEYLEGDNKTEIISSMSTNIHEISHGYFSKNVIRYAAENNLLLDSDNVAGYIFISPNESYYIEFPRKYLFPSKELAARIPRKLRTSRFNTYINGKTLTQSHGLFGLLDELHAFYMGSKFSFEMLEGYKIAKESASEGFYQWLIDARSSMTAFFEFDFFILEYLLYMKSNYPQNYESLKSYQPFHDAYAAVRIKYRDLLF